MSIALVMVGLLAFVAPIFLYVRYFSGKQVLYEGTATCRSITKTVFEHNRRYGLVFVDVPGHGELLAEISHSRATALTLDPEVVTVTVIKRPLSARPEIQSIAFGNAAPEPAAPTYEGLGLSLYYFALAAVSLVWLPHHVVANSSALHVGLLFSALCFAATGFSVNVLSARDNQQDLRQAKSSLLFIPLGSGYAGLYTMWILTTALTVFSFWSFSLLILFPGLHAAFAAGSIPGVLWRNRKKDLEEAAVGPVVK